VLSVFADAVDANAFVVELYDCDDEDECKYQVINSNYYRFSCIYQLAANLLVGTFKAA